MRLVRSQTRGGLAVATPNVASFTTATILVMLRHSAPLRPVLATLTAGLSVSAITATALSLIHNPDASIMVLAWNLGTMVAIIAASGTIGRRLLRLAFARD